MSDNDLMAHYANLMSNRGLSYTDQNAASQTTGTTPLYGLGLMGLSAGIGAQNAWPHAESLADFKARTERPVTYLISRDDLKWLGSRCLDAGGIAFVMYLAWRFVL